MTSRTTRRTRLIAAVSATAGALALTLLPTTAAFAVADPAPVFSFIDSATLVASVGTAAGGSSTLLMPDGYRAYDLAAATDGSASVMSICHGSVAACTDKPTDSKYDATFGVVFVRAGASRLLTNFTDTNPVMTPDGSTVMWIYANTLHTFLTAGQGTYLPPVALSASKTEAPIRLAVSSDATTIAVMYEDTATAGRVVAMSVANLKSGPFFEKSYAQSVPLRPNPELFALIDASTLVYDEFSGVDGSTRTAVKSMLSVSNLTPASAVVPNLQDYYRLEQGPGGTWWGWKDTSSTESALAGFVDPLTDAPTDPQGGPIVRTDSGHTYAYTPSSVAPAAFDPLTVANPAASHPSFSFLTSTVGFNGKTRYTTSNLYGGQEDGLYLPAGPAESYRGTLQVVDAAGTWHNVVTTGGAATAVFQGSHWYNGNVLNLRRTTTYRWVVPADGLVGASGMVKRTITVIPTVSVKVVAKGKARTVTGAVTRPGGVVQMQRLVRGKWVPIVSAKVVKTGTWSGRYAFAKRALPRGSFRVVTIADVWAAQGAKVFKV